MLPYLMHKPKDSGTVISRMGKRPMEDMKMDMEMGPQDENDMALESAAEDLLRAIDDRSIPALKEALRATFDILESMPHEESDFEE